MFKQAHTRSGPCGNKGVIQDRYGEDESRQGRNYRNNLLGDVFKQYYGIGDVTYQQKQIEGGRHR